MHQLFLKSTTLPLSNFDYYYIIIIAFLQSKLYTVTHLYYHYEAGYCLNEWHLNLCWQKMFSKKLIFTLFHFKRSENTDCVKFEIFAVTKLEIYRLTHIYKSNFETQCSCENIFMTPSTLIFWLEDVLEFSERKKMVKFLCVKF